MYSHNIQNILYKFAFYDMDPIQNAKGYYFVHNVR